MKNIICCLLFFPIYFVAFAQQNNPFEFLVEGVSVNQRGDTTKTVQKDENTFIKSIIKHRKLDGIKLKQLWIIQIRKDRTTSTLVSVERNNESNIVSKSQGFLMDDGSIKSTCYIKYGFFKKTEVISTLNFDGGYNAYYSKPKTIYEIKPDGLSVEVTWDKKGNLYRIIEEDINGVRIEKSYSNTELFTTKVIQPGGSYVMKDNLGNVMFSGHYLK